MIQCDREIKAKKPDIVVVNKNERSCAIIDIAIPGDIRVSEKEKEKIERYQELKREIKRVWNIRSINDIPVVVGARDSTSKKLKKCIEELGVVISTENRKTEKQLLQKTALLGTARILSKESFRLQIRSVYLWKQGWGKGDLKKTQTNSGKWRGGGKLFQKLNRSERM